MSDHKVNESTTALSALVRKASRHVAQQKLVSGSNPYNEYSVTVANYEPVLEKKAKSESNGVWKRVYENLSAKRISKEDVDLKMKYKTAYINSKK